MPSDLPLKELTSATDVKCEHVSSHISSNYWEQSFFGNLFNANLPLWQLMGRSPDIESVGLGHVRADDLQEMASRKDYDTLQWLSRPSDRLGRVGLITNSKSYRRAPARMYPRTLRIAARPGGRSYTHSAYCTKSYHVTLEAESAARRRCNPPGSAASAGGGGGRRGEMIASLRGLHGLTVVTG